MIKNLIPYYINKTKWNTKVFQNFVIYKYKKLKYAIMSKSENNRSHKVCVQFTKDYFESNNVKTTISQNPNYDLIVDGRKCKVLAHEKKSGKFVVEYVCGDRSMNSVEYDDIIYMEKTLNDNE